VLRSVFGKTLWERRRGLVWWMLGMAALALLTVAFWPSLRDQAGLADFLESFPPELLALFGIENAQELLTPAGFVSSRLYASIGPILLTVFAISVGTSVIAGEEDRGTMDLLLSQPVARRRLVLEGTAAMVVLVTILAATLLGVLFATNPVFDLQFSGSAIVAANVGVALLALVYGSLALAVGGLTGNRAITLGVSTAVVVFGWFINALAEIVDELRPAQEISPFHWFLQGTPLARGWDWPANALMAVVAVALVIIAVWAFERRDVAT
jgi:ABC-2 type transport system permease protein